MDQTDKDIYERSLYQPSCNRTIQCNKNKETSESWDDSLWRKDMQDNSTMSIHRRYKHSIRDEQDVYDNTASSVTLFRTRTGT